MNNSFDKILFHTGTAMIFGGPHVYTFDGTYYTFPGYKKPGCMYALARDVRDNKFTILSQETAIIVVTEDATVKIHQDGRVETIVKVSSLIATKHRFYYVYYIAKYHAVCALVTLKSPKRTEDYKINSLVSECSV